MANYQDFYNMVIKSLKDLQDQLNDKVDYPRLTELEKLLMDKLHEVVDGLTKQLADKMETKKNLKSLERQLRNLLDVFMQRQGNPDEDNAMLSKKPLGGFSCASCDKNLININGKPPEYYNWNRFPPRDPSERIARVGQGFSRMLSMKPDNFKMQSVKQGQYFDEQALGDHTQSPLTHQNFYQGGQQDYQNRPVSAQVLPGIKEQK